MCQKAQKRKKMLRKIKLKENNKNPHNINPLK